MVECELIQVVRSYMGLSDEILLDVFLTNATILSKALVVKILPHKTAILIS